MEAVPPPPPPPPPPVVDTAPPAAAAPVAVPVMAAPATADKPTAAPPAPPAWNNVMKEELLVDSYYMVNFNGFKSGQNSLLAPTGRVFDYQSNSFTMNYAKIGLEVDSDPVTVRADLGYGYLASIVSGASGASASFLVQQAYASLKIPMTPLTLDMGRFVTGAGAEVIEANKNWLYSRSYLFGIIPFYHSGARLTAKVNDQFSAQLTVANSQNSPADPDVNANKVVGLQLAFNPLTTTSIIATGYLGKEGPQGAEGDQKLTVDVVASHAVNDVFGLNLNLDYVKQGDTHVMGAALMARYVAAEHLALALRGEFLNAKPVAGLDSYNFGEGTIGAAFPFAGHFEARVEVRGDFAGERIFPGANPSTLAPLGEGSKSQFTGTVAFLGFM